MLSPFVSLAIIENLFAESYFTGATKLHVAIKRRMMGLVDSVSPLGLTLATILLSRPHASPDRHSQAFSAVRHTIDSHCRPWRYVGRRLYKDVPDADYHASWGWWFYFKGLDALVLSYFQDSEQAFQRAATFRRIENSSADMPLNQEECANLDELHRLLPLTELAIRSRREADVTELCHAFIQKAAGLQQQNPTTDYEKIACRHLGLIYHRCYALGVSFSPDGQCGTQYSEADVRAHVRKKGLEFYEKAIVCGYVEVMSNLGHDPKASGLIPSRNALDRSELLNAPARFTGWLRWMAPWSTYALFLISLASYGFTASWVFRWQTFTASATIQSIPLLTVMLKQGSPLLLLSVGGLYMYTLWCIFSRLRKQSASSMLSNTRL